MSKGLTRERQVARLLRDQGWVVGSLRHTFGGGDLIASRYGFDLETAGSKIPVAEVKLIEVKSTNRSAFAGFPPADRKAMLEAADKAGATACLAWWPTDRKGLRWYESSEWPPVDLGLTEE